MGGAATPAPDPGEPGAAGSETRVGRSPGRSRAVAQEPGPALVAATALSSIAGSAGAADAAPSSKALGLEVAGGRHIKESDVEDRGRSMTLQSVVELIRAEQLWWSQALDRQVRRVEANMSMQIEQAVVSLCGANSHQVLRELITRLSLHEQTVLAIHAEREGFMAEVAQLKSRLAGRVEEPKEPEPTLDCDGVGGAPGGSSGGPASGRHDASLVDAAIGKERAMLAARGDLPSQLRTEFASRLEAIDADIRRDLSARIDAVDSACRDEINTRITTLDTALRCDIAARVDSVESELRVMGTNSETLLARVEAVEQRVREAEQSDRGQAQLTARLAAVENSSALLLRAVETLRSAPRLASSTQELHTAGASRTATPVRRDPGGDHFRRGLSLAGLDTATCLSPKAGGAEGVASPFAGLVSPSLGRASLDLDWARREAEESVRALHLQRLQQLGAEGHTLEEGVDSVLPVPQLSEQQVASVLAGAGGPTQTSSRAAPRKRLKERKDRARDQPGAWRCTSAPPGKQFQFQQETFASEATPEPEYEDPIESEEPIDLHEESTQLALSRSQDTLAPTVHPPLTSPLLGGGVVQHSRVLGTRTPVRQSSSRAAATGPSVGTLGASPSAGAAFGYRGVLVAPGPGGSAGGLNTQPPPNASSGYGPMPRAVGSGSAASGPPGAHVLRQPGQQQAGMQFGAARGHVHSFGSPTRKAGQVPMSPRMAYREQPPGPSQPLPSPSPPGVLHRDSTSGSAQASASWSRRSLSPRAPSITPLHGGHLPTGLGYHAETRQ